MEKKIHSYIRKWKQCGYTTGIPDEVPHELMKLNLAPSYKAIAIAILSNDHNLISLGFSAKKSMWYDVFKKIELRKRNNYVEEDIQLLLFNKFTK